MYATQNTMPKRSRERKVESSGDDGCEKKEYIRELLRFIITAVQVAIAKHGLSLNALPNASLSRKVQLFQPISI
jgi:hypothetical protein